MFRGFGEGAAAVQLSIAFVVANFFIQNRSGHQIDFVEICSSTQSWIVTEIFTLIINYA